MQYMRGRWTALWAHVSLVWYLYLWTFAVFLGIASLRHDARLFGVDFTGFFIVNGIACLIYLMLAKVVPSTWWLVTLPWRLRSRSLAAGGVVAAVALWLALLLTVIPHYFGTWGQLVFGFFSEIGLVNLYRFVRNRRANSALLSKIP